MAIRAYTLVELIIVIVILGIISAGILPNLGGMSSLKTNFYQRQLIQALRAAKRLAIASECFVSVKFTSSGYEVDLPNLTTKSDGCSVLAPTTTPSYFDKIPDLNGLEKNTLPNANDTQICSPSTVCTIYFNAKGQCLDSTGTMFSSTETQMIKINNTLKVQLVGETGYAYAT